MIAAIMAIAVTMTAHRLQGFVHGQSEASDYEWPTDECVIDSLQAWRDLKFGVLLHWGLYSVPGIVPGCAMRYSRRNTMTVSVCSTHT